MQETVPAAAALRTFELSARTAHALSAELTAPRFLRKRSVSVGAAESTETKREPLKVLNASFNLGIRAATTAPEVSPAARAAISASFRVRNTAGKLFEDSFGYQSCILKKS